jgi:hypothetical protein
MPTDANRRIEDLARRFVTELQDIARAELVAMLGGGSDRRGPAKAARSRSTNGAGRGAKRSPAALESLKDDFLAAVKESPGKRIEELAPGLGVDTKQLALPVKKLIAEKALRTTGTRRATRYFPAGSGRAKGGRSVKKAKRGQRAKR